MVERTRARRIADFSMRSAARYSRFSHQKCIQRMGGVIVGQSAQYLIAKLAIEPQGGLVIDRRFQVHLPAAGRAQPALAFVHKQRRQSQPSRGGNNVERQNASSLTPNCVGDDKACNFLCSCRGFRSLVTEDARFQSIARVGVRRRGRFCWSELQFVKLGHQRYCSYAR